MLSVNFELATANYCPGQTLAHLSMLCCHMSVSVFLHLFCAEL